MLRAEQNNCLLDHGRRIRKELKTVAEAIISSSSMSANSWNSKCWLVYLSGKWGLLEEKERAFHNLFVHMLVFYVPTLLKVSSSLYLSLSHFLCSNTSRTRFIRKYIFDISICLQQLSSSPSRRNAHLWR